MSLIVLSFITLLAEAQSSITVCALVINKAGNYDNRSLRVQPGQTVCIQGGHYDNLYFANFVGSETQPIRFVNTGGQVGVGIDASWSGIRFTNCSYFVMSGSGDSDSQYGFVIDKASKNTSVGVGVGGQSTDYEIERVEVSAPGYTGFMCKLDPGCDSMSWNPNFVVRNVKIHDNYVHNVTGPGMFLGSGYSNSTGTQVTCDGTTKRVYPVQTEGLSVHNNLIESTGGSAFNINNCPGAQISNNTTINNNLGSIPAGWQTGGAAGCRCDYTVTQAGTYNNVLLKVGAGKTICIQAGHYDYLRFTDFVGTAAQPIQFINCGGQVTAGVNAATTGIQFVNSRYFRLTGSGASTYPYGIKLTQSNANNGMGISVGALSSDCEIDHIEVAKAGFAGIMVKTDPNCDSTTWRSNFSMSNVKIHDNYIHDVGGEGLYIGNSFYGSGMTVTCNGMQKQVLPHLIYGLEIYNNRIERTGAEGLQYGCAPDASVHHNWISDTGISPFAAYQNNGLQVGGGAGGDCYSNTVLNASAAGIVVVGHLGNNRIFNNVVSNAGQDGIFCDDRAGSVTNTAVAFVNNTIVNSGRDGIRLYNEINKNSVVNNAITGYGATVSGGRAIVLEQGATATRVSNFTTANAVSAGFTNLSAGDFTPSSSSPMVNTGTIASNWGVVVDAVGQSRPTGANYDIGALEHIPTNGGRIGVTTSTEENGRASVYPTPAQDKVTIRLPEGFFVRHVKIYSQSGQLVKQFSQPGTNQCCSLSSWDWPTGVYVYEVITNSKLFSGRIVKQ